MATQFKHSYKEFGAEAVARRVKQMVEFRDQVDVASAHVKFSYDNRKTGALVPSVSLIPVADCGNCKVCARGCYDVRNVCFQKTVQKARANNSAIAHEDPDRYFAEISEHIAKRNLRWFRFHAGADILNAGYFNGMIRVAKDNPHCRVLAFTKMFSVVNRWIDNNGELPENLQIIFSEWKGQEMDNPYNLPTSRPVWKGEVVPSGIWCGGNCSECAEKNGGCWSLKKGQRILFEAH